MTKEASSRIMDGRKTAGEILREVALEVKRFGQSNRPPNLAVIIVGDDPASKVYVRSKEAAAGKCGIQSSVIELPGETSIGTVVAEIERLNSDRGIDGFLVQMPLPAGIDKQTVIERISPDKDVDGCHPYNLGRLAAGAPRFIPCTAMGIVELLTRYGVDTRGKNVVIIGRSLLVGKPLALLLSKKGKWGDATVTMCHSRTEGIEEIASRADILVAAVGKAETVTADMVKEGAVVVDVGINRVADPEAKRGYRLVGDVDFEKVSRKASLITPVPGGVGPLTVAILMRNTLQASLWARGEDGSRF